LLELESPRPTVGHLRLAVALARAVFAPSYSPYLFVAASRPMNSYGAFLDVAFRFARKGLFVTPSAVLGPAAESSEAGLGAECSSGIVGGDSLPALRCSPGWRLAEATSNSCAGRLGAACFCGKSSLLRSLKAVGCLRGSSWSECEKSQTCPESRRANGGSLV
jgi:hypothetical protein